MKKLLIVLTILLLSVSLTASGEKESGTVIGISKLMSHPALDAVEQAVQDYFADKDYDITFNLQNANGDISTAASIAQQFKMEKVDIALGIATPSAQALVNVFSDIPVVFSAITDPVSAGLLADNNGSPDTNVCGVSDSNPVKEQIKLLAEVTGAKVIGNVYSSNEANGIVLAETAEAACEELGLTYIGAAVSNSSEVKQAAQSIAPRVDAIYVATDNGVCSATSSIADVCTEANIGFLSADPTSAEGQDYLIAWGFDYYSLGIETAKTIEKIINGEEPGPIGTVFLTDPAAFQLWFNKGIANKLGIEISQDLLNTAAKVVE